MYCKFCGNEVDSDAVFCPACGKRQDADGNLHVQRPESKEHPVKSGGGISGNKLMFLLPPILIILTGFMPWIHYGSMLSYNLFEFIDLMSKVDGTYHSLAVVAVILGLVCFAVYLVSAGSVLTDSDSASRRAMQVGIVTAIFASFILIIIRQEATDGSWFEGSYGYGGFLALALSVVQIVISRIAPAPTEATTVISDEARREREKELIAAGGWKCDCGRVNAHYVSSCACGKSKREVESKRNKAREKQIQKEKEQEMAKEKSVAVQISEYKELLDKGVLTQEEFDSKKKQLLGFSSKS